MDLGLHGQVAVVTGASRGIGLAVVRALLAEGVDVVAGALSTSGELDALSRTAAVRVLEVDLDGGGRGGAPRRRCRRARRHPGQQRRSGAPRLEGWRLHPPPGGRRPRGRAGRRAARNLTGAGVTIDGGLVPTL